MRDKTALVDDNVEVSYFALWNNIETLAKAFLKLGLKENDKIVIFVPNCKEFIYSFYAFSRINAISIPLNPSLTSFELKRIFDDCKPDAIVTTSSLLLKKIVSIFNKKLIFVIDEGEIDDIKDNKIYHFKELFTLGSGGILPRFSTSNNQIASINYTYRGLGMPMGALLTHGNYHHGAITYVRRTEIVTSQNVLCVMPMSHIFTLISAVIVPLLRGATVYIMRNFIPSHVFKAIQDYKIDFIIAVPTLYVSLLENYEKDRFDISCLKYGITGASILPLNIHNKVKKKMGIELLQGYGLTETMPITCNSRAGNNPESLGIAGHRVKLRIVDEEGKDLAIGKKGEILISALSVMQGYLNREEENKEFLKDGWFWTGDYGKMDRNGYLYFSGIKKNIAKVGGNNVDLKEVKDTLLSFEGVKQVEIKVVNDKLWGSRLCARLSMSEGKKPDERQIRDFCKQRLAVYKIPRKIDVVMTDE